MSIRQFPIANEINYKTRRCFSSKFKYRIRPVVVIKDSLIAVCQRLKYLQCVLVRTIAKRDQQAIHIPRLAMTVGHGIENPNQSSRLVTKRKKHKPSHELAGFVTSLLL